MAVDLILGTAGHIDHGKTSLIRALTGTDTDRLPEEKRRGITIELGFASLDLGQFRLGIVDVPGHERFVRNMLAGATGIDLALLVVAADDSVKPQTREHLEILRLLRLQSGVIALTKCDLADPEWIELVEEEVRELISGSFLEAAPIVRTSASGGEGIGGLRDALAAACGSISLSALGMREEGPFRMAIDRAFTIAGHGTVVTGSVSSGTVRTGDELRIEPGGVAVRVRSLQNHDQSCDLLHRGQRAAINLAGIHHHEVRRGQELSALGHLVPTRRMAVRIHLLDDAPWPLKNRARVRCHVGTAEAIASVVLLDRDRLEPGATAEAELFLSTPIVGTWGQALVIRAESPVITIGGGRILDPGSPRLRRNSKRTLARLADLDSDDPLDRASAAVYFAGSRGWQPDLFARAAGIFDDQATLEELVRRGDVAWLTISAHRKLAIHSGVLEEIIESVEKVLSRAHDEHPLSATFDRTRIVHRFRYLGSEALLDAVLHLMHAKQRVHIDGKRIALAGRGPRLSPHEKKLQEEIVRIYREAAFHPPTVPEVQSQVAKNQAAVPQLASLAAAEGTLVAVSDEYYLHAEQVQRMCDIVGRRLADGEGLTVSQIREMLSTSRKYAVPFCEYMDRIGFTSRQGDVRVLADRRVSSSSSSDPPALP